MKPARFACATTLAALLPSCALLHPCNRDCGAPAPSALVAAAAAPAASPAAPPLLAVDLSPSQRAATEATGKDFAIAAQGPGTANAAAALFRQGGNIIDAAVAASFAAAVEMPQATGLGGGGFLLFRDVKTKKVYSVDFRERAPLAATHDMFLDARGEVIPGKSLNGILSVAVPGMVAGLVEVHERFGRLPLKKVLAPAIELAEKGFPVSLQLEKDTNFRRELLAANPAARAIFLKPDGSARKAGETLVQKDLAKTLRLIARQGRRAFYRGEIATALLETSAQLGGVLSRADLNAYSVKWRDPLSESYRGHTLYSMPPPSSGGIHVFQILNILESDNLPELGVLSTQAIHRTAAAMQLAFADRSRYSADPDFAQVPTAALISKPYARELRATISPDRARPSSEVEPGQPRLKDEHPETTHFSIIDGTGNMVAATETINYLFGSGVVVPGTGIVLNDEMDDFSAKAGASNVFGAVGGEANSIVPQKTPLSSMAPTLVLKGGAPVLAVGAPGGTRIISCVAQTLLNYLAYGLPAYESVAAVRFHHQWRPDRLAMELPGPGEAVERGLEALGYQAQVGAEAVSCRVELVTREGSTLRAVADPRDPGQAVAF